MPAAGDAGAAASEDNGGMDRTGAPRAPAALARGARAPAVAALASRPRQVGRHAEPASRDGRMRVSADRASAARVVFTTLPLGLLWATPAAAAVAAGRVVLSLTAFHALTVAGLIAQLVLLYRLRPERVSSCWPRCWRSPFLVLGARRCRSRVPGLDGHDPRRRAPGGWRPAAAGAGATRRARERGREHQAARQVIAGTLAEHTGPRGARPHRPRAARRCRAPHFHDRRAGGDGPADHAGMPAAGAQRLSAIGDTARAALTEMRRLLGVLREDTRSRCRGPAEPQPGLRQLNELLDQARDASGRASASSSPAPDRLAPGVELAAYRIVQEALTNARRHAPGAAVDVELHYNAAALRLRVRDNGPGPRLAPGIAPATGCSACGNGPRRSAASCRPAPPAAAVSSSRPCCPRRPGLAHDRPAPGDPDRGRRRPRGGARRVRRSARHPARLRGRRHRLRRGEAVRICRELRPDVVLMDVRMPGMDGIEATRQLADPAGPGPRMLILTTFDLDEYVYDALRAGASGFLLKDVTAERLFDAVRVIAAGEALLAPAVTRRLISEFALMRPQTGSPARGRARHAHPPRDPGAPPGRRGPVQPGDRSPADGHRGDRQDARQPDAKQARAARPDAGGGHRLRVRTGRAGQGPRLTGAMEPEAPLSLPPRRHDVTRVRR